MRVIITTLLITCSLSTIAKQADTIRLYYAINVSDINTVGQRKIDSLVYADVLHPGKKIGILGYADFLGSEQTNATLSETRANKVKDYLLKMGMRADDIQIVIGKGEVNRGNIVNASGYPADRRVDIIPGGFKEIPMQKTTQPALPPKPSIDITKVKKNEAIRLNNILFYPGSHKIREESMAEVDNLYNTMKDNPTLKIRIEGHICCLSAKNTDGYDYDSQDFRLSENRAQEIYDILTDKGIDEERMQYKGFGKTKPLVMPEKNEEDENKNRRVEIRILEK